MDLNQYQIEASSTAAYREKIDKLEVPDSFKDYLKLDYAALGLAGEAGEVANKVKKIARDDNFVVLYSKAQVIKEELGDVLWYAAAVATELGVTLEDVAKDNLDKLKSRKDRGVLSGSGDNR